MLKKVVYVALYVSDQDKAVDFYTRVIGRHRRVDTPTPDGPRFLTVGVPGQDFELVLWPGAPGKGLPVQGIVPGQYTIEVDSCRIAFEVLTARGVEFEPAEVLE